MSWVVGSLIPIFFTNKKRPPIRVAFWLLGWVEAAVIVPGAELIKSDSYAPVWPGYSHGKAVNLSSGPPLTGYIIVSVRFVVPDMSVVSGVPWCIIPAGLVIPHCLIDRAGIRIIGHIVINILQAGHVI